MIGSFIGWIIIGALAGWISGGIMKRDFSLLTKIVVGIVGALVGGWLFSLVGFDKSGWWWTLLTAVVGACIFLGVLGVIKKGEAR